VDDHVSLEIASVAALALNWRTPRRRTLILAGLGVRVLVRVWTFLYFVPEITQFMVTPRDGPFSPELAARVSLWGTLGWVRRALIAAISIILLLALPMPAREDDSAASRERRRGLERAATG
jgi:hypothetical protein